MPNVKARFSTQAAFNVIRIDDKKINFDGDGIWSGNLATGVHVLTWNIKGVQGDKYSLEIVSPESASLKREVTLDGFGLDFGFHEIGL